MDYRKFSAKLFEPIEARLGPLDQETLLAIIGFDAGGPLNFCTVGKERNSSFVTYISCELAVRGDQKVGELGPYELMMTCDDENWCRSILSEVGRMSLEVAFGHSHILDIGPWVRKRFPIQGIAFEAFASVRIGRRKYSILQCHGLTRLELNYAVEAGAEGLLRRFKQAGIYPKTTAHRQSVELSV